MHNYIKMVHDVDYKLLIIVSCPVTIISKMKYLSDIVKSHNFLILSFECVEWNSYV